MVGVRESWGFGLVLIWSLHAIDVKHWGVILVANAVQPDGGWTKSRDQHQLTLGDLA